jgi:hypothetical protein
MAGCIDDVDLDIVMVDGTILGINGDAAFAFERVTVHDLLHDFFIFAKHVGLREKSVDKRTLSGVYVGNDCDIDHLDMTHW